MNIKSGLKFLATIWVFLAAVFIVGWVALKVGALLAGVTGAMVSLGIIISVFVFLIGCLL